MFIIMNKNIVCWPETGRLGGCIEKPGEMPFRGQPRRVAGTWNANGRAAVQAGMDNPFCTGGIEGRFEKSALRLEFAGIVDGRDRTDC